MFAFMFYIGVEIIGVVRGGQASEDSKMCRKMGEGVVAMKNKVWAKRGRYCKMKRIGKVLSELENG